MNRFFVENPGFGAAVVEGEDFKHLASVLRLKKGDCVMLSDGRGNECEGEIDRVEPGKAQVKTGPWRPCAAEPAHRITLFQCLPKAGKMEIILQKCTELGVSALVPTLCASLTAAEVARLLQGEVMRMALPHAPITAVLTLQTAALAVACAILSIVFCVAVHRTGHLAERFLKNPYLRAVVLGAALLGLTLLSGGRRFNGAGMDFVERAVAGEAVPWYAFGRDHIKLLRYSQYRVQSNFSRQHDIIYGFLIDR